MCFVFLIELQRETKQPAYSANITIELSDPRRDSTNPLKELCLCVVLISLQTELKTLEWDIFNPDRLIL